MPKIPKIDPFANATAEEKAVFLKYGIKNPTPLQWAGLHYFRAGAARGCPKQQMVNLEAAGIWLQEKQLEFAAAARACDFDGGPIYVGFGGPRGPGKSFALLSQCGADDCQRFPGLKVLYLRKVGRAAKEQFEDMRVKVFGRLKANYRQGKDMTFENGSRIIIGHFKDEKEIDNYLGQEYDEMVIEELTTLSKEKVENLLSCLRTSKEGWRPRLYASWNWGGVGHGWVKRFFWDPYSNKTQGKTKFIRARPYDNKHLDKEYMKFLESLVGWKRQSWLEGNPDFQAGQFFTTWSESDHVLRTFDERKIVRWYAGLDYGWTHPSVFLLAGEDRDGNLIFLDEHSASQMQISDHTSSIFAILRPRNLKPSDLEFIAAGRDCFSAKEDGTTISDTYAENGIQLVEAEIDRINGWAKMLARLGDPDKGIRPTMFIHERCKELIGQIPLAQHHEKKPEDIEKMDASAEDDSGGDDALDCCFHGDTRVMTHVGEVPIESLCLDDKILTSCGYRKIVQLQMRNPVESIRVYFSDGRYLIGTKEHRIWVDDFGWKRLDSLRFGDNVSICVQKPSYSTESSSEDTRTLQKENTDIITHLEAISGSGESEICTSRSGSPVEVQFQKDTTSTIKTETALVKKTIRSRILNALLPSRMYRSIHTWLPMPCFGTWSVSDHWLRRPIEGQKFGLLPAGTLHKAWEGVSWKEHSSVISADKHTRSERQTMYRNSVLDDANRLREEKAKDIWKKETARSVAQRSSPTNTSKPELVHLSVQRLTDYGCIPVYNLQVEDCPEYFANGILVHNCRFIVSTSPTGALKFCQPAAISAWGAQSLLTD